LNIDKNKEEKFMNHNTMNSIFKMISLITTFALLIAMNTHADLSGLFYIFGGSIGNAETVINGNFNRFFISSLGITSFIVIATYILIVRCETIFAKVLLAVADIFLLAMVFVVTQERVLHNFTFDAQASELTSVGSSASSLLRATSDTTLLTIVLVHMVIMLIGVIRTYKLRDTSVRDKASAYD
jgi:hypothetical protein